METSLPMVLSHVQARPLLEARRNGQPTARTSPDLGLTTVEVRVEQAHVIFPDGQTLTWETITAIAAATTSCFAVREGEVEKVYTFSELTGRPCSLMPTAGAPTLLVAGFPMHRIKDAEPHQDSVNKVKAIAPLRGRVLDTATGLGYTAIEASKTAREVITIELDPAVLAVARLNPWSQPLFDSPNIRQLVGDSAELIAGFDDGYFHHVIHDPPTASLAGELYSLAFYRHLFRVTRRGGRLFHYLGNPDSQLGQRVMKGAVRRLKEAGFVKVRPCPHAFGVVACRA